MLLGVLTQLLRHSTSDVNSEVVIPLPELEATVLRYLDGLGFKSGSRYAVVQPTSKFFTKEWTAEGFAEIADYLAREHGLRFSFPGVRVKSPS